MMPGTATIDRVSSAPVRRKPSVSAPISAEPVQPVPPVPFLPLTFLPLSRLRTAPSYQRRLKWHRVWKIAQNFDPGLFGAITIARYPDGTLGEGPADGRHRVEALAFKYPDYPDFLVPCFVIPVQNKREETLLFERLNRERTAVSSADVFYARLDRKDPKALDIQRRVEQCGWTINPHAESPIPWNTLTTTYALESIYDRSPLDVVETLEFMNAVWPEQIVCRYEKSLVAVARFLTYYGTQPRFDEEKVRATLRPIALKTILREIHYSGGAGDKRAQVVADEIARVYNENRPQGASRLNIPVR